VKRNLTDTVARNAKPKPDGKPAKYTDGGGLYLLARADSKYWRYDYTHNGKRKTLALGIYPDVGLKLARERHQEARELLAQGIDPSRDKQAKQEAAVMANRNTFELVAREWLAKQTGRRTEQTQADMLARLENHVFPWIGRISIADVHQRDVMKCLQRLVDAGKLASAKKMKIAIGQVFKYAMSTGRTEKNPVLLLPEEAVPAVKENSHAAILNPKEIGGLMRAISVYDGSTATQTALQLSAYLFQRPGEIRHMEWSEVDLEQGLWSIPGSKMKAGNDHVVPLPSQAITLLKEIQPVTGRSRYVFPSIRSNDRPMSENTVRQALRNLGYENGTMTAHGFRSMASTSLYEMGFSAELIERQLAHTIGSKVRRAYDKSRNLPERASMMQTWADHLDSLRDGAEVIPLFRSA